MEGVKRFINENWGCLMWIAAFVIGTAVGAPVGTAAGQAVGFWAGMGAGLGTLHIFVVVEQRGQKRN